jgi:hypothetical protein
MEAEQKLVRYLQAEMKGLDDLLTKTKLIIKKNSSRSEEDFVQVTDYFEQALMRVIFSFHPTKAPENMLGKEYLIFVGTCLGHQTFFVMRESDIGRKPEEDDAISVKKCLMEMAAAVSLKQRETSETRY